MRDGRVHACVHVRTRCTRRSSLHENAVRSFCSFRSFRSFVVYIPARAHTYTHIHACTHTELHVRPMRTCVRARVSTCAPGTYVWVLTFHDLSRSFQRASKRPESAQIDKRNNRGREIEGLDLIRREKEIEGEKEGERERRARDRARRVRIPRRETPPRAERCGGQTREGKGAGGRRGHGGGRRTSSL